MAQDKTPTGPDLAQGIALADLADGGMLAGHVGDEPVLLVRRGTEVFAVGAQCSHYHAPLVDGLVVGETIRCPWHHACFDVRTGEALRAPAFDPIDCWLVEQRDGRVFVREKRVSAPPLRPRTPGASAPKRIVIVGGGAAAFAAAEQLRRERYEGSLVMLSDDDSAPTDRPNLSKDYLAGNAPEDWLPLRPAGYYPERDIDLRLGARAAGIDVASRSVLLADGTGIPYDRLLLATGCRANQLSIPGARLPHVFTLRSLADCRAIIARSQTARRAVVLGASFIGLEVAASLRARDIDVHVVAPGRRPMERVLGAELGDFVRSLHEEHGVVFHFGEIADAITGRQVHLRGGCILDADLVVAGIGVAPRLELAEGAGLVIDRGVVVNGFLETSMSPIFAAGDIARWPDAYSGAQIRVEHWVVAERQGQVAALNMLGHGERYADAPFFWSQHYDAQINYVGHAEAWDELVVEGSIASRDCLVRYLGAGRTLAVASIGRDVENLRAELEMEQRALDAGRA